MKSFSTTTTSEAVPCSAMLMAAGLGTRLKPFTDLVPKALVPVMGVPVAQFALDMLADLNVPTVVANVHHMAQRASEGLHRLGRVVVSDESNLLLGSAGGIAYALPHLGSRFFILNADVLCDSNLRELAHQHQALSGIHGVKLTLTVFPQGPAGEVYREIDFDPATKLVRRIGDKKAGGSFFTGVSIAEASLFADLEPGKPWDFVQDVLLPAVSKGQVAAYSGNGSWHDVGSPLLWWKTHLDLIHRMELGKLPRSWRTRIERESKRIAPLSWCSKRTGTHSLPAEFVGPVYLDAPLGRPKAFLGPNSILYSGQGVTLSEQPLRGGIGFGPHWVQCQN